MKELIEFIDHTSRQLPEIHETFDNWIDHFLDEHYHNIFDAHEEKMLFYLEQFHNL